MVGLLSVDENHPVVHSHRAAEVILRVEGVDATGTDDYVVDVGTAVVQHDAVDDPPAVPKASKSPRDLLLPIRSDPPCTFLGLDPEHPTEECLHRCFLSHLYGHLSHCLTWSIGGQIAPFSVVDEIGARSLDPGLRRCLALYVLIPPCR